MWLPAVCCLLGSEQRAGHFAHKGEKKELSHAQSQVLLLGQAELVQEETTCCLPSWQGSLGTETLFAKQRALTPPSPRAPFLLQILLTLWLQA